MTKANIHESVIIEDGAKIASDVVIGPFCTIGKNVKLKSGCRLESNVILKGKLKVDKDVKIFSFTSIGNDNSDIEIGAKTHIREFCQIGSQDSEDGINKKIIIGSNNFLMGYVQILSGVELGDFCILTNAVRLYENVKCEEKVIIGGLSTIEANNTIGAGVMIGGASVVNHDIPPFTLVEGNKASVKGLNIIGLRRRLKSKDDIEEIKAIYKKVLADGVDKELAKEISDEHQNEYVKQFTSFIASSNI
ncbi:MAG: acyl-ACP--UDP-N- acetylglucosamine O-acyltransferase [Sulfurimonas sp.]|nr:acyl-ACP--UDP-N- acetylglucosamine O-acyltransferase [Sulfurimonas sp.]